MVSGALLLGDRIWPLLTMDWSDDDDYYSVSEFPDTDYYSDDSEDDDDWRPAPVFGFEAV